MLWALSCAAIPIALLVIVALFAQHQTGRASVESYGSTITAQLAALAAAPLVTQNYIDLSVIANNLADDPAIVNATIYTLDDRLVGTGGRVPAEATQDAPRHTVFVRDISFEAQRIGYVRVVVDADTLVPAAEPWILGAAVLGALAAMLLGARLGEAQEQKLLAIADRMREAVSHDEDLALPDALVDKTTSATARLDALARLLAPDPEPMPAETQAPPTAAPYLLVLNLFNQGLLVARDRDAVYLACERRLLRVLEMYSGKLVRLPGTGLIAVLDSIEGDDHAFSAICAALLALRMSGALNLERERNGLTPIGLRGGLLRLERALPPVHADALINEIESSVPQVLELSAMAKDRMLAIDRTVFEDLLDNQRVQWTAIRSAISHPGDDGRFHYQIGGVTPSHEALLTAQSEKLLAEGGRR